MKRRIFLQGIGLIAMFPAIALSSAPGLAGVVAQSAVERLRKPRKAWRELVSPEAYRILFEEYTEEAGSSELNHEHREGVFVCAACYLPLFESQHKYESGSGWPSFTQPIAGHVGTKHDFKLLMLRIEYHCARCGGHQGHVFKDGPLPRGERWCNNGLALRFVPETEQPPPLRD